MSKTREDLVRKALDNLGVSAAGQDPEVEDLAKVDANVDAALKALGALEIVSIPDPDTIPDEIFLQVATVLAEVCKTEFGLAADEIAALQAARMTAEGEIRVMVRLRPTYRPLRTEYF